MTPLGLLSRLSERVAGRAQAEGFASEELPLRSELFSAEQMAQHGIILAGIHKVTSGNESKGLLERLADNEKVLSDNCNLLMTAVKSRRRITPAGEWLLDNFYLIEEQIRTARRHLPKGYSRELPRLSNGPSAGLPRVYDIALATISHGDGRVDAENLSGFVASYQTVAELQLGELWAIPIMLRLALIENLRRVAARIGSQMVERDLADNWADQMIDVATNDPKSLILVVADMARSNPPTGSSFVAELSRRLSGQSPALALGLTWIEQRLLESGLTIDQLVQVETQAQAADQLSVSNSIGSLRFLGGVDWHDFVEKHSIVERILSGDRHDTYTRMDFATRDQYRHVVERLAKKARVKESLVAQTAIDLAVGREGSLDERELHVGFYLVDDGLPLLEKAVNVRYSAADWLRRIGRKFPLFWYLGSIAGVTIWLTSVLFELARDTVLPDWQLVGITLALLFCSSQLTVTLVNWLATLLVPSRILPKMDYSDGIPAGSRTLVVVPTMLVSNHNIDDLTEALEVRFLGNRDKNLYFGLLTDFTDADSEHMPQDEALVAHVRKRIEELNRKYKTSEIDVFYLFHRSRKWNPREKSWMGYERKRGKLAELNSVLRGGDSGCFSLIVGDLNDLSGIKYVITLDTDTQLPRDAARQIIGAMAHPLNRAFYDESAGRVTRGYGILQPRVGVSLPGANQSLYAAMHSGDAGIDPYTRAVSDVYQDVFREGSFIGKGIYDIDAFESALKGRFPQDRILSHDLLEGCYARSGLVSDVELYEDYPATYGADVSRQRRWIRGDWQLTEWLLPRTPTPGGHQEKNPLTLLSHWKLFDNLRRSLVAPLLVVMLILSWTVLSQPWLWTLFALAIYFVPPILFAALNLSRVPQDVLFGQHFLGTAQSAARNLGQALLSLVCLPYEAFFSADSILRTTFRMVVSHRRLLAWNPSGHSKKRTDLAGVCAQMASAPMIAVATGSYLAVLRPEALPVALPILLGWFLSPAIAWWISLPLVSRESQLAPEQRTFLRKMARKTWSFFEMFVSQDEHWLPPDNFQESPLTVVAHRTSPTNMGLSLLANLTAHDFGYIQTGEVLDRTQNALSTMRALERHRGHLYNWYDTQTLRPLPPRYISTVDSGNLAGHLITLKAGLKELADEKIIDARVFNGMEDTVGLLIDALGDAKKPQELASFDAALRKAQLSPPSTVTSMKEILSELLARATELSQAIPEIGYCLIVFDTSSSEASTWAASLKRQCSDALNELLFLAPWIAEPDLSKHTAELAVINTIPTLKEVSAGQQAGRQAIQNLRDASDSLENRKFFDSVLTWMAEAGRRGRERLSVITQIIAQSTELADLEYEFLFDRAKRLLAIGYNVEERRVDSSCYDLLASEARLCNFVAIAQERLPQETWFALGRLLTTTGGEPVLFSWSGSMFEYLMPLLVMPTYNNTLLQKTCKVAVERQIEYGKQVGVPWGISESGYYAVDVHLNYQYRAFGVPGLGLKRGLSQDLVIAPYATALALMVAPEAACFNLQRLKNEGFLGRYGFYEAIDYTPSRIPPGQTFAIVKSFMAHHQGMSFLSIAYALLDKPMQRRFESDPSFQATALLLQERIPKVTAFHVQTAETSEVRHGDNGGQIPIRIFKTADTSIPEVQLLSNGRYHVMLTNSGGGFSRWKELAVNRWREDSTCDNWGTFTYIRDLTSGDFWSVAYQPTLKEPEQYEAIFSEARVEFRRRDHDLDTHTEIVVSSEDDIELRRVRITNRSRLRRVIDVTTYTEVVLAMPAHDAQHPAFSNLFVESEVYSQRQAILCHRRPRSVDDHVPWMFHLLAVHGAEAGQLSYETDRMQFVGRGNTAANPKAMQTQGLLSGSQGSVLDPIAAIRCVITLEPEESVTVNMVTGIAESRQGCLDLVEKYHDRRLADRVFDLAWTHSQVVLRQLNASESDGQLYAQMANSIIYANQSLRADPSVLIKNRRGQSGLWGYAISGDLPIVLLQIRDVDNINLVRQLVQAHAYWRLKGLAVDLVIWNEDQAGYRQLIQDQIMGLIASGVEANLMDRPGGIFVRTAEQVSIEDRILFQTVARAIIKDSHGSLADQVARRSLRRTKVPALVTSRIHRHDETAKESPRTDLALYNGMGGFTPDGREYVITTNAGQVTPLPWVNVLANPYFGTVLSESGSAYTWLENAHEFRLSPWNNDPVTDTAGEAFYIRDEESGYFWSPCPLPARGRTPYVTRHGFGYTVFEHTEGGITSELLVYVALDAPVKLSVLKVRNNSGRTRRLSATSYIEWLLGDLRSKTAMFVTTEIDPKSGALFARNTYSGEFPERIAFLDVDEIVRSHTGDRMEFLGRNGKTGNPAAMSRARLSGKVGAGLDPCGAIQVPFELADGQEREVVFRLGIGQDTEDATSLINRFRGAFSRRESYEKVCEYWKRTLGAVHFQTPDPALNMMVNGWLLYQVIGSRIWARSGYYQSGGAFGFRDQLQDAMALIHTEPLLLRKQLLLCASRQFIEGDVQHWWHPPSGRGVRTRISDDYLWLPLAACRYVIMTGDTGVLDEQVPYLTGRPVNLTDDSYYDLPGKSEETATLYEHCKLAITHGLRFGPNGIPLMGCGDWNDGMNLVGEKGIGESVWLGFFLYDVLRRFSELARNRRDHDFANRCDAEAAQLRHNIEKNCWDGGWYRRAYFDDGTPLGSKTNDECQIDSISQSWSVLSRAGTPDRSQLAMDAVYDRLVRRDDKLIQLLDPPFDKSALNPGYIKGYVPGVRENGGQYTHAAIWTAMAFAAMGDSSRAWELLTMINPANHALSPEAMSIYRAEPYVMAADIYAVAPHTGRGGWTWYTGSAGWMYRLIVESLLGVTLTVDKLSFAPSLPAEWTEFKLHYRYRETVYHITVLQSAQEETVTVDGVLQSDLSIHLIDDRREHHVQVAVRAHGAMP